MIFNISKVFINNNVFDLQIILERRAYQQSIKSSNTKNKSSFPFSNIIDKRVLKT